MQRIALALAALALAACGGGGGGSGDGMTSIHMAPELPTEKPFEDVAPIISASGGTPLDLPSAQISRELQSLVDNADTLLTTRAYLAGYGYADRTCQGVQCTVAGQTIDLRSVDIGDASLDAVMTKHNVSIMQGASAEEFAQGATNSYVYGGWMEHNAFFLVADVYSEERETTGGALFAATFGKSTGSVPVRGSATWEGVMVGVDISREEGHQGDAIFTVDFGGANIDAAFTNVHEIETGAGRPSIYFDDVPMLLDGFTSGYVGNGIEGRFYGPDHAEIGGTFERNRVLGAFGAKRQ